MAPNIRVLCGRKTAAARINPCSAGQRSGVVPERADCRGRNPARLLLGFFAYLGLGSATGGNRGTYAAKRRASPGESGSDRTSGPLPENYRPISLVTRQNVVAGRYYPVAAAWCGVIWVGGIDGDWDTPAQELYPRLCQQFAGEEIASLRIRYRYPTRPQEALKDVLVGLQFLAREGISAVTLVGHSFGGAVVIQAAAASPLVRTVVTLSAQSYGTATVAQLAPRCSILFIHGTEDEVLSPINSYISACPYS